MIYTLMNKHIPLADINFSSLGHIDEICKVYTPEAFPVGIITKDNSPTSKITRDYLYNWWKNRMIDKISKYVGNRARLLENIISKVNTLSR